MAKAVAEKDFVIEPKSIQAENMNISIAPDSFTYDGADKTPVITVSDGNRNCTLVENTDYELSGDTTKTTNVLKWTKVADADGYVIYGNKCNTKDKSYTLVKQVTIKDGSTTTWTDKHLASGTYYKYVVKANKLVDGKKVWLAKSKVVRTIN